MHFINPADAKKAASSRFRCDKVYRRRCVLASCSTLFESKKSGSLMGIVKAEHPGFCDVAFEFVPLKGGAKLRCVGLGRPEIVSMYYIIPETPRPTMNASSIDRRFITGQAVVNGRLVTEFQRSLFHDGSENHPAGTLVCDQPTEAEKEEYRKTTEGWDDDFGGILSETVTRFETLFWDKGVFTPRSGS